MITKRQCIAWIVLCTLATTVFRDGVQADEPLLLRVLSYNIHHAEGVDRKLDLQRIADVILSARPDLVALQEVDQTVARTNSVDQPAELARMTKFQYVFGANIDLQGGHYGNAILSRYPVIQHRNHLLPCMDQGEQRGVLVADIQLPDRQPPLRFFATHLDHRGNDRERIASADAIHELAKRDLSHPMLLAGDLNDTPHSETLQRFYRIWTRANDEPLPTIPVKEPTRQIDFVLYRPANRWRVVDVRVLDEAVASDHRPILAVFELLPMSAE